MYRQAKFDLRERREGQLNQAKKSSPPTLRRWFIGFCTTDVAAENHYRRSSAEALIHRGKPGGENALRLFAGDCLSSHRLFHMPIIKQLFQLPQGASQHDSNRAVGFAELVGDFL